MARRRNRARTIGTATGRGARRIVTTSVRKGKSFIGPSTPVGSPQVIKRRKVDTVNLEIHQRAVPVHKR